MMNIEYLDPIDVVVGLYEYACKYAHAQTRAAARSAYRDNHVSVRDVRTHAASAVAGGVVWTFLGVKLCIRLTPILHTDDYNYHYGENAAEHVIVELYRRELLKLAASIEK
jgi:hypothetical protein